MEDYLASQQGEDFLNSLLALTVLIAGVLAGGAILSITMGLSGLREIFYSPMFFQACGLGLFIAFCASVLFYMSVALPVHQE